MADLKCFDFSKLAQKDSSYKRLYQERGISEKSESIEIGNKIAIKKGQQTFINRIQFKTCLGPADTAIYRINIYSPGKILKRVLLPVGMVKIIDSDNQLKEPIIVRAIGKTEIQDIDVSKQYIEVDDDIIIGLQCIYTSNTQMNIGAIPSFFNDTDLMIRENILDDWIKVPMVHLTFVSATLAYKKNKSRNKK